MGHGDRREPLAEDRPPIGPGDAPLSPGAGSGSGPGPAVRAAVAALPRRLREAVVLRFYGGFTEAEMAAALRVPAGTVKSRLARARGRLAEQLRGAAEEER